MRALIQHLLDNNLDAIVARSLNNCHAKGVSSIVLIDAPGERVRLFVAHENHDLARNSPALYREAGMSIGFHPHHCNITLQQVAGTIWNWIVAPIDYTEIGTTKYSYESSITGTETQFIKQGYANLGTRSLYSLGNGESCQMDANELHTITCEAGEVAAWFVFEGKEDPEYEPVCYSTSYLEGFDPYGLYTPMTAVDVFTSPTSVGLI